MKSEEPKTTSRALVRDLQARSKECHKYVRSSFESEHIEYQELKRALKYYFSYWTDFTHPGLFSIAFEASGGTVGQELKPQAALAMMAAAFDVHDDIIDKSVRKHNYPTVFGKFGQDIALLLGDAFLIKGMTLLNSSVLECRSKNKEEVFTIAKDCLFEMGNAHALELEMKGRLDVSPIEYLRILEMKGASIEADMHIASLLAGGSENEIAALKNYGRIIGTLATLREESVDIFETEELNRRVKNETLPLPLMFALQDSELKEKIMKFLKKGEIVSKDINQLADIVFDSKPVVGLKKKMEKLCERAAFLAQSMTNRKSAALLVRLAQSMLEDL